MFPSTTVMWILKFECIEIIMFVSCVNLRSAASHWSTQIWCFQLLQFVEQRLHWMLIALICWVCLHCTVTFCKSKNYFMILWHFHWGISICKLKMWMKTGGWKRTYTVNRNIRDNQNWVTVWATKYQRH